MGAKIIKLDNLVEVKKFVVAAAADQVISDLLAQALGFEPSECEFIIIGSALFSTPKGVWVVEVEDIEFIG
jgi:hypothetical protein